MKKLFAVLTSILIMTNMQAQNSNDDIVKEWQRAKNYTKEYLDAMPETGYSLKPTKEMRSFAAQFLHLSDAIYGFIAAATDEKSPVGFGELEKSNDVNKTSVTNKVMAAYDFAINAIKKYPKENLPQQVKMFGRFEMSKLQAIEKCFEHQTHHRGQATVYLRLAGATPPAEKLF
ncbi:MAG TPA: damage-inducible protein DinB [Chitinophagaceae bacterium]|jgi:uncharacterized damage-inducible protein DinB|nr:damage-inducible protein DinB [Chitinophagaceae bacterium]